MMKTLIKSIIILLVLSVTFTGCDTVDFGDTNDNVNGPKEVNTGALLSGTQRRYAVLSGRSYRNIPSLNVQYQAQPVYQDESRYSLTAYGWSGYYVQTLSNLKLIIDKANDEAFSKTPAFLTAGSKDNQIAVARIMKVLIFKKVTDTYGDVPYKESLDKENLAPKYDPQEEIYKDFVKELKEARDQLKPDENAVAGDLIFAGDPMKWKKFANSLLMSVSLQMSKRFPTASGFAATAFKEALNNSAGVIESVEDEAWFRYQNKGSLTNPWSGNRPADYNLSEAFISALKGDSTDKYSGNTEDPRIAVYSNDPSLPGLPYGLASYEGIDGANYAQMSTTVRGPEAPLSWMTSAYTYYNRAEAAQLGWTSEDKEEMLKKGLESSFASLQKMYEVDLEASKDAFVTARLAEVATAPGGFAQVVAEEKWVSLFTDDVFQGWAEWRRTGYPMLDPSPAPLNNTGEIPRRYLYPSTEQNLNDVNYKQAVSTLSPAKDDNTSRVWWDK